MALSGACGGRDAAESRSNHRYQSATETLPSGFLSNKIDLSGTSVNVWFQIRY